MTSSKPVLFLFLSCFIMSCFLFPPTEVEGNDTVSAGVLINEGRRAYMQGNMGTALESWTLAENIYRKTGNSGKTFEALILKSRAYRSSGRYDEAVGCLHKALKSISKLEDNKIISAVYGNLGAAFLDLGDTDRAEKHFQKALSIARKISAPALLASLLNDYGNFLAQKDADDDALAAYEESGSLAAGSGQNQLEIHALMNQAILLEKKNDFEASTALVKTAVKKTNQLPDSHDKAGLLISAGRLLMKTSLEEQKHLRQIHNLYSSAARVGKKTGNHLVLAEAWGEMGRLYGEENRPDEALELFRRASFHSQAVDDKRSLYKWQWETARILKTKGKTDDALAACRRAVDSFRSSGSATRFIKGNLYEEMVDLLLLTAASKTKQEEIQPLLMEARETMEMKKLAELADFLEDSCVVDLRSKRISLDLVSRTAVVIYPVMLEDRTELLVSLAGGLKQVQVPVNRETITKEIRQFRQRIEKRTTRQYMLYARRLYNRLIRPLENLFPDTAVDTLVFVPEGPLLTIPFAALHDGHSFLIEKFALAVTPGLNLTDPGSLNPADIRMLTVGVSEAAQGFPPIPNVIEEVKLLSDMYGGKVLLDRNFLLKNFETAMEREQYNIVHIASHARFDNNPDKTFLLTYDGKLTIQNLDKCIGLFKFRETPLELLGLSACETAAGDDRAALGLAGVAVKAGAKSALATLWAVNDAVSSELVTEFYRQIRHGLPKSLALRKAQRMVIAQELYAHPGYWAPFILINNWL